jgi:hypothetical protein
LKISVRAFSGMRPVMAQDLLKPGEAVAANNTLLTGGDLEPFKAPLQITTLTSATPVKTIYRYGQSTTSETQFWFQSTNDVNFVKGPVDQDTEERTYFTGHLAYPAKTKSDIATSAPPYPSTSFPMGLCKPANAATAAVSGVATDPASTAESVTYVTILVTSWGETGPASDASNVVSWRAGQTINLTGLPTSGVASYPGNATHSQNYTTKRIYRSATGSTNSARFLFVAEVSLATTTYSDTTLTANLGESLLSRFWLEPPDNMLGLTQMANGILAGYSGSTVCFSEPGVPYAWPVRYQQSVDAPIVAMGSFGQSLVVSTTRSLYVFTGTDPGTMTQERLAVSQTCVSKRSMVEMLGGVVFATPDGLGFVGYGGFKMLTEGLMSRREWAAYFPSTMYAYESDNRYLCFYDNGSAVTGLVFSFGDEPNFSTTSVTATAGFRDKARDALYLCVNGSGTTRNIVKWDSGTTSTLSWLSGVFRLQSPINMATARIDASGPIDFELLANGEVIYGPVEVECVNPFWLPANYRSTRYQFRLTGTSTVRSVEMADSRPNLLDD